MSQRNEKWQMPKEILGAYFVCEWHSHRDVLQQPICNLCTVAWYFLISNSREPTSVCNLNLSCSLGASGRDIFDSDTFLFMNDFSGIWEKILSDDIPTGNDLLLIQFQSINTSRHTFRITYMNNCAKSAAICHFIIMILLCKCWKFVWGNILSINTNSLYIEEFLFKSLSRNHRNYQ